MSIDIEELKERILRNVNDMRDNFPNLAKNNSRHAIVKLSFNEQVALLAHLEQQAEIEKLKAESKANLKGWKQARRIIDTMNKRLRK